MTETAVNIPLLRKAVEWAEAEAAKGWALSEWHQALWRVDPAFVRADAHYLAESWGVALDTPKAAECGTCYCIAGFVTEAIGGDQNLASELAKDALGLTPSQATGLFRASNTIEEVREIAETLAGERL